MTREEQLACLIDRPCNACKFHDKGCFRWKCVFEEEPTEAEPCEDCISRAEAINALGYDISITSDEGLDEYRTVLKEMLGKIYDTQKAQIEALPSIQPKTDVLDKIRAEIEAEYKEHKVSNCKYGFGLLYALKVIDKHISGKEK